MRKWYVVIVVSCIILAVSAFVSEDTGQYVGRLYTYYRQYGIASCIDDYEHSCRKCDSLTMIYCTPAIYSDTKDDRINGVGYDFPTDDYGIDTLSARTLSVKQKGGYYQVEYDLRYKTDTEQWEIRHARLRVEMEGGKICKVTNMDIRQMLSASPEALNNSAGIRPGRRSTEIIKVAAGSLGR